MTFLWLLNNPGRNLRWFILNVRQFGLKRLQLKTLIDGCVLMMLLDYTRTVWMSNDFVPVKNVESSYGGGVSPLPGAAGGPPPAMFPVAPALLAEGPQLGPWQVAVVRVDETPAGDSS